MANKKKYKISIAGPNDPIFKEGFKINPININQDENKPKTWDDLIERAVQRYGKDSSLAQFWRETKDKDLRNKKDRFEEIYFDRPVDFQKDEN